MILVALAGLAGVADAWPERIARREGVGWSSRRRRAASALCPVAPGRVGRDRRANRSARRRYREECDTDAAARSPGTGAAGSLHALTMWGFLGLLAATMLDYGLALVGIKATGTPVPIWYPVRLLGTVAGLMLVYGATMLIVDRYRGRESIRQAIRRPRTGRSWGCSGSPA